MNLIKKLNGGNGPVAVPPDVYNELEKIRQSGRTNMFDRKEVLSIAYKKKYYSVVDWILRIPTEEYGDSILYGIYIRRGVIKWQA